MRELLVDYRGSAPENSHLFIIAREASISFPSTLRHVSRSPPTCISSPLPTGNPILHCGGARNELLQRTSCDPCRLEFFITYPSLIFANLRTSRYVFPHLNSRTRNHYLFHKSIYSNLHANSNVTSTRSTSMATLDFAICEILSPLLSSFLISCHAVLYRVPSLPRLPMNRCLRLKMTDLQLSVDVYRGRLRLAVIAYSI